MGVHLDTLLYEQRSAEFEYRRRMEADRGKEQRKKREDTLVEEVRLQRKF